MYRREFLMTSAVAPVILNTTCAIDNKKSNTVTSNFKHSICRWCYNDTPLETLVEKSIDMGIHSIELLSYDEWDTVLSKGLDCAVSNGKSITITDGFNDPSLHSQFLEDYKFLIPRAAERGIPNIICFSGNRRSLTDAQGLENCAAGLDPVVKLAEKYGITIIMELLNSKLDHVDYQCDNSAWGTALVDKIGSPNFRLLYDIYHMQIMEGDIIATIRKNKDYIAHYHTGGVPGRNEIDDTQELNYKTIMQAVRDTGYVGFVAQEFIPTWKNPFEALSVAIDICSV